MARQFQGELADTANAIVDAQAQYTYALGVYQQACEMSAALWADVPDDADEIAFSAAFDLIESLAPTTGAYDALRTCEDVLVSMCRRFVVLDPRTARKFAASRDVLDKLFNGYRRYPMIAAKLVRACAMLDPYQS